MEPSQYSINKDDGNVAVCAELVVTGNVTGGDLQDTVVSIVSSATGTYTSLPTKGNFLVIFSPTCSPFPLPSESAHMAFSASSSAGYIYFG